MWQQLAFIMRAAIRHRFGRGHGLATRAPPAVRSAAYAAVAAAAVAIASWWRTHLLSKIAMIEEQTM